MFYFWVLWRTGVELNVREIGFGSGTFFGEFERIGDAVFLELELVRVGEEVCVCVCRELVVQGHGLRRGF